MLQGTFALITPAGLLQVLCQEQRSVLITAKNDAETVQITIYEGLIVGAASRTEQGPEVIYRFASWSSGIFKVELHTESPSEEAMAEEWEGLLLEAARRRDEEQSEAS